MVKITGRDRIQLRFDRITGPEQVLQLGAALKVAGDIIGDEAAHLITEGSVSGKGHVPSKPGEPPNSDTHVLDRSIQVIQETPLRVKIIADAPYARALEYGTSKMAERPFMRPALANKRKEAISLITRAAKKIVAGGKATP